LIIFAHKLSAINSKSEILITGGTGFLGAYIIKTLIEQGYAVRAIKRPTTQLPSFVDATILEKVEWVEGDILDIMSLNDAMTGIDIVIHCAAIVSFSKADRKRMMQINVEGTKNLVNTALDNHIRRFVHISSVAAIGRKFEGALMNENAKWEENGANTPYAISKFNAELEVWRGFAEGLNGVILNPATILGYGNWKDGSCALFKTAYKEFRWYTDGVNGFTDVEDVARATVLLMQNSITEQRYIVCNDNLPFRTLFNTMADCFEKKRPSQKATPFLSGLAWRMEKIKSIFSGKKPVLTKESAKVANSFTRFDNSKLLQQLPGFEYTPLSETIKKACALYMQRL